MVELRPSEKGSGAPSFADVVGQWDLKTGLLIVAADPHLDGFLIRGEKGTAKSTAVRALADLLPRQRAVADCPYGCPPEPTESHDATDGPTAARQCADCRERTDPPVEERPVPLVTLPLGATRERVVGTLSVSDALAGDHEFDPGLLARANRGILYVDEVNLLDDHLVDVLLDAAASGVNRVERDGVSVAHPASFTLIGTMNPEEGDLRPQLRDRFAISTTVTACEDLDDRVAIVERALGEEGDATDHRGDDERSERDPAARFAAARDRLERDGVDLPKETLRRIARVCRDAGVDGHRGDLAVARTARALAALSDRGEVLEADLERAVEFALAHRLKSRPFADDPNVEDVLDEHFDEEADAADEAGEGERDAEGDSREDGDASGAAGGCATDGGADGDAGDTGDDESGGDRDESGSVGDGDPDPNGNPDEKPPAVENGRSDGADGADPPGEGGNRGADGADATGVPGEGDGAESRGGRADASEADGDGEAGDAAPARPLVPGQERAGVGSADAPNVAVDDEDAESDGRRGSRAQSAASVDAEGPRVRSRPADDGDPVDASASVRAAAKRGADGVESRDLRASVRRRDAAALVTFVVDASASMRPAMRAAKGTVLELLRDAYEHRDEVAFVAFAGEDAEVLLPPTDSVTLAARHLKELPSGDRTPLPAGLRTAGEVLDRADPAAGTVVVVTDGRANVADGSPTRATREAARALAARDATVVVVDAGEDGAGVVDVLVDATDGERVPLSALTAERVDAAVGSALDGRSE